MKLPYNVGETATEAAQRFIMANELPHEFLEKLTKFIEEQMPAQAPLGDPLTGSGRYVPGASNGEKSAPCFHAHHQVHRRSAATTWTR